MTRIPADPAQADDAGVKTYLSQVTTADKNNTITVSGWLTADLTINTLQAGRGVGRRPDPGERHPGGPQTRTTRRPMLINGINWAEHADADDRHSPASRPLQWSAADKAFKAARRRDPARR